MNFRNFFITYYRHVCEPILIHKVAIGREWTGFSHVFVTLENSKIVGGYRSLNIGVQKCKRNRCLQPLLRPDGCEISLKSDSEMLLNGYNSMSSIGGVRVLKVGGQQCLPFSVLEPAYESVHKNNICA